MRVKLAAAVVLLSAGVFATSASAIHVQHAPNGVVPMFCGVTFGTMHSPTFTIPAGTPLTIRLGWGTKSYGQSTNFLAGQRLLWTITDEATGAPLITRPDPGYGDSTDWSAPVTTSNGGEQRWLTNYQHTTGLTLTAGQTVRITYELTADRKTDDGFGFKFEAREVLSGGSTCTVTGV